MPATLSWIDQAAKTIGVPLKRHTSTKAVGPCPHCHAGRDRLVVFEDGNYWCHVCRKTGWWLPVEDGRKIVAEARAKREAAQTELRAQMAACTDWQTYHQALFAGSGALLALWYEHGVSDDEIRRWGLGWCAACPLAPDSASLTIPVFAGQTLIDIRHRLLDGIQGDKYRSHLAGLLPSIYNADALHAHATVVVVEGEKKAIAGVRAGYPATLGMPGAQFGEQLLETLAGVSAQQRVILALDPDQAEQAAQLALRIGEGAFVADFPLKPDDFLFRYGARAYAEVLQQSRPVRVAKRKMS